MTQTNPLYSQLAKYFPIDSPSKSPATALALLGHERIMAVSGPDSAKFLQGQLTCDVTRLPLPGSVLGARCNPKGRMQSSFRLLRHNDSDYLLAMAEALIAPQITDLAKYAAFFKTKITDASDSWVRLGLHGENAPALLAELDLPVPGSPDAVEQLDGIDGIKAVRLPGSNSFELWLPAETALPVIERLLVTATAIPLNDWQLLQIRSGIGQVFAETREAFIPQMLNLQVFDAVSFKKGCYTGQEIVARMKYLGKLKKRMFRLASEKSVCPAPGTPVVNRETGQVVGEVVMAALGQDQMEMLAVIQKDAAQLIPLCAIDSQGPALTLATLPYESEVADEADEADQAK